MWSLTLASLAALAVAVDCTICSEGDEPLNKTMRRVKMSGPMTWSEVDVACRQQFGVGFVMLNKDFLLLTKTDKALCRGHLVPLRLSKDGLEPVVWPYSDYVRTEEEVNSTYLSHMRTDRLPPRSARWQVGSLDLSTGQWRLVDNNTNFACAMCQRSWVKRFYYIEETPPPRPRPFDHVYTCRIVETGENKVGLDEAIRKAEERLNETVDDEGTLIQTKIVRTDGNSGGKAIQLRLKSSWLVTPEGLLNALQGSYSVDSWQSKNDCPAMIYKGHFWDDTFSGGLGEVRLAVSHFATRLCSWKEYPDGDWDAVWDDRVFHWMNRWEECRQHLLSNLVRRLQDYAEQDDLQDVKSLVEITAANNDVEFPHFGRDSYIANYSQAIDDALSSLLVSTATDVNATSTCQGVVCVLLSPDIQGAVGPDNYHISNEIAPLISLNTTSAANQTTYVSLQLPIWPSTTGRVAAHARFVQLHTLQSLLVVQVISNRVFNESEPDRSRPPLTFHVNNDEENSYYRHWFVLILAESEESSLPCPLVRSQGSVDTYTCNKWERGPRNFTAAKFVPNWELRSRNIKNIETRVLLGYTTIPLDKSALLKVANFTNSFVEQGGADTVEPPRVDALDPWQEILSGVVLTEPVLTASMEHVKVLVSDLTVNDPVVGFSLDRLDAAEAVDTVTASSRNDLTAKSAVDLVLGGDLQEHCKQLAILAVSGVEGFGCEGSLEAYIKRKLMVVHLVATLKSATEESPGNVHFDIQLRGDSGNIADGNNIMLRFQVATWSEAAGDWSVSSCAKRRSTRASKSVVRCESLTVDDGGLREKFLVFEPVGFAEALGPTFLAVLIAAGVLSCVSLASIAVTATFLPAWRKDVGHKILLHMALALSFNLALGFTSSFVSLDAAGVACIAVGALRHFSFLAMFAWMLVMSSLQLRRLLSVLGARSTPNLQMKVSIFSWGVPTLAVGSLLMFNLDMYQSDIADRGFCYPEGTAFTWSVQVPAATVLTLNVVIFVVILARLYGFLDWDKKVDLRRHLNERSFQMRRVRAVFFTFFLFGLTWLFHLLAEQGVFKTKFLYEYLFLMTASVHVFSLSCIFVFFDPEARAEWVQVFGPVRVRLGNLVFVLRYKNRA